MLKIFLIFASIEVIFLIPFRVSGTSFAASTNITVGWDKYPSAVKDLAGFRTYVKDSSSSGYTQFEDIPAANIDLNNPQAVLSLSDGKQYDIVITAYDNASNESSPSNVVPVDLTDVDNDGLTSYLETYFYYTDPLDADSDNDGINDGDEVNAGYDPLNSDTDSDGLPDLWEWLNPDKADPTESNLDEYLSHPYKIGWPQSIGGPVSSINIGDIDGDRDFEIVAGYLTQGGNNSKVYAFHHDGTLAAGWPQNTVGSISSVPAIGDLDSDNNAEIVAGDDSGVLYAWNNDGTTIFTASAGAAITSSPVIADIDRDGDMEIIVGAADGYLYAWHHDGQPVLTGLNTYNAFAAAGDIITSSPAVGDIDNDNNMEIVVGSDDGYIYAWHHDGQPVLTGLNTYNAFAATGGAVKSSPALVDIDGDRELEIFAGSNDGNLYGWHRDGSSITGWPRTTLGEVISSPAVGDVDGDGEIEIVAASKKQTGGTDSAVYVWKTDGTDKAGWPVIFNGFGFSGSPVLGDIDGDKNIEVIIGGEDSNLYAFHHDGTMVTGWPIKLGGMINFSPALLDIDRNGNIEILAGSDDNRIYVFNSKDRLSPIFSIYDSRNIEWAMFRRGPRHCGIYLPLFKSGLGKIIPRIEIFIDGNTGKSDKIFLEDATSSIFGAEVIIPSGALVPSTKITISEVKDVIPLPGNMLSFAAPIDVKVDDSESYDFGNNFVTLKIPYSSALPSGISSADLTVMYNNGSGWVETSVSAVDEQNMTVSIEANHFSLFTIAYDTNSASALPSGAEPSSNSDGGGSGGGCFISAINR